MQKPLCIIVGMGAGVSLSVARRFARAHFQIAMLGRRRDALTEFETQFAAENFTAAGFVADAANENSLRRALTEIETTLGECEVLIYNAYAMTGSKPSELAVEDLRRDFEANLFSPLVVAQSVLPLMKKRGRGVILFTGGGAGLDAFPITPRSQSAKPLCEVSR